MGSSFVKHPAGRAPSPIHPSNVNIAARAFSAPGFASQRASAQSRKDLGAASGFVKMAGPIAKSAAADAKGPKI